MFVVGRCGRNQWSRSFLLIGVWMLGGPSNGWSDEYPIEDVPTFNELTAEELTLLSDAEVVELFEEDSQPTKRPYCPLSEQQFLDWVKDGVYLGDNPQNYQNGDRRCRFTPSTDAGVINRGGQPESGTGYCYSTTEIEIDGKPVRCITELKYTPYTSGAVVTLRNGQRLELRTVETKPLDISIDPKSGGSLTIEGGANHMTLGGKPAYFIVKDDGLLYVTTGGTSAAVLVNSPPLTQAQLDELNETRPRPLPPGIIPRGNPHIR